MRGAAPLSRPSTVAHGIIPARAGSRPATVARPCIRKDHPRACGEQAAKSGESFSGVGSSPRVRGAASTVSSHISFDGLIPARAGSRGRTVPQLLNHRDHPRACGEQQRRAALARHCTGSSPRVRGAARLFGSIGGGRGIIPARAGSSCLTRCARLPLRDHPRACGEQSRLITPSYAIEGSSPRVRGADGPNRKGFAR